MPSAELGTKNPHASLYQPYGPIAHYQGQEIPVDHALPYHVLDGYDRKLKPKAHRVAVLESDRLKATFLLDLGGRLWSLIHKPTGRELLYVNPVFQPANFGIRNAWFSGGIEWNMGIFGHCVFTCVPVYAAQTVAPDGGQGIRFWEYERSRGFVWQVDAWAPEGSDFLYWSPRIVNPHDHTIPMYWWTCLTVEEERGGRVLSPAISAMEPDHAMGDAPVQHDLLAEPDLTYPQKRDLPRDTYFDIPADQRPWIGHASADGRGVVHVSSPLLKGRKQWVWGMEHCGRRWQEWLNPGAPPYIEIQGGLAGRQSEYVPMPAGAEWSWLEAYGPMEGIDASDWAKAVNQVNQVVETKLPALDFRHKENLMREARLREPGEIVNWGSGWGFIEQERRCDGGLPPIGGRETPFLIEASGEDESYWLDLVSGGELWSFDPSEAPGGYAGAEWSELLEQEADSSDSWIAWLHLGVARFHTNDWKGARKAWEQSFAAEANGWAERDLAVLDKLEGNLACARQHILHACELLPREPHLIDEACRIFAEAGDFDGLADFLDGLDEPFRCRSRVRLARALIALQRGRLNEAASYFAQPCDLVDIREAETTVSDLWRDLCERDPSRGKPAFPPPEWDFRMTH